MEAEEFSYVWLNLIDGSFSNSWPQETQDKHVDQSMIEQGKKEGWKLIKYRCLTDDDFLFYNQMKLK